MKLEIPLPPLQEDTFFAYFTVSRLSFSVQKNKKQKKKKTLMTSN